MKEIAQLFKKIQLFFHGEHVDLRIYCTDYKTLGNTFMDRIEIEITFKFKDRQDYRILRVFSVLEIEQIVDDQFLINQFLEEAEDNLKEYKSGQMVENELEGYLMSKEEFERDICSKFNSCFDCDHEKTCPLR